ncbi:MAG: class I SAM-dependent methyltransferase [Porticoccaceae bacterium]
MQSASTDFHQPSQISHQSHDELLKVAVVTDSAHLEEGRALAVDLGLPFLEQGSAVVTATPYVLHLDADGLTLISQSGSSGSISCDFMGGKLRHRHRFGGGSGQAISRAIGVKSSFMPSVADLTAGLGADAFVLAGLGAKVTMVERHPVVAALLSSGINRALRYGDDEDLLAAVKRMQLIRGDARDWLSSISASEQPDVIYLDPMFPERNKKSAQVKKEMQVLQALVGKDDDIADLLDEALTKARYRVVVKRPRLSDPLADRKPSFSVTGKSTRFDVYALAKLPVN